MNNPAVIDNSNSSKGQRSLSTSPRAKLSPWHGSDRNLLLRMAEEELANSSSEDFSTSSSREDSNKSELETTDKVVHGQGRYAAPGKPSVEEENFRQRYSDEEADEESGRIPGEKTLRPNKLLPSEPLASENLSSAIAIDSMNSGTKDRQSLSTSLTSAPSPWHGSDQGLLLRMIEDELAKSSTSAEDFSISSGLEGSNKTEKEATSDTYPKVGHGSDETSGKPAPVVDFTRQPCPSPVADEKIRRNQHGKPSGYRNSRPPQLAASAIPKPNEKLHSVAAINKTRSDCSPVRERTGNIHRIFSCFGQSFFGRRERVVRQEQSSTRDK